MKELSKSIIPAFTEEQWAEVQPWLTKGDRIQPWEFLKLSQIEGTSVLLALFTNGLCTLRWMIYHSCQQAPVARRDYMDGFQPTPWKCQACYLKVTAPDDLRYELEAELLHNVKLV